MGAKRHFLPEIAGSGLTPCVDAVAAKHASITLLTEVVDVAVSDPQHTITLPRNTAAQLSLVAVIRKLLVESADLHPQTMSDEEGESRDKSQIDKEGLRAPGQ